MKKVIAAVVVVAIVVVAVIALTGNKANAPSSNNQTNNSSNNTSDTKTPAKIATNKVSISNEAFSQANITVKKGTTVTWTNNDAVAHTVTETDSQDGPNSQDLNQGQTYSFTFNKVGTFQYDCSIHPFMTGTVTVTE
ncbi:MAG TPA: plastocyanin/azurin family copper-binding protein [Candidatus Saccharimonadales bacterium]|nr:plastocyanin/azurin family copper-binding protein [Candidatus Saccharimonadales bacterium]